MVSIRAAIVAVCMSGLLHLRPIIRAIQKLHMSVSLLASTYRDGNIIVVVFVIKLRAGYTHCKMHDTKLMRYLNEQKYYFREESFIWHFNIDCSCPARVKIYIII